jgi:hypothetical protein
MGDWPQRAIRSIISWGDVMKTTLFAIFLACATAAMGQSYGAVFTNPTEFPDHPQRAQHEAMAREQNLWQNESPYTYAKGELPLSDFARASTAIPLGDVARSYREAHAVVKRATIVWVN